jgi:hypothetical protein
MSEPDYSNVEDTHVPHEGAVAEAIDAQMERTSTHAAIANPGAPGGTYAQAEAAAVRDALVSVLEVLRDAGLIPAS